MDTILAMAGLQEFATCYVDDIVIYSDTADEHIIHVCLVLVALFKNNLKAHPNKSIFVAPVMEFLGFQVNGVRITPIDAKVAAIRDLKSPTSVPHLRSLLGFLNYYRQFVDNFSFRAAPLTELLKKKRYPMGMDSGKGVSLHGPQRRVVHGGPCTSAL